MRDFLDSILNIIGATSLTDDEFNSVTAEFTIYDQATYDDLARILNEREAVSSTRDRLIAQYKANGFDVTPNLGGGSKIYVGGALG